MKNKRKNINDDSLKYKSNSSNTNFFPNLFSLIKYCKNKNCRKDLNLETNNKIFFFFMDFCYN